MVWHMERCCLLKVNPGTQKNSNEVVAFSTFSFSAADIKGVVVHNNKVG